MARDVDEAQRMLAASQARPNLVAQIVPSPLGLECGATVARLLAEGFVGDVRELVVLGVASSLWDDTQPVHWRQDSAISGRNVLALGILHETLLRWLPQPKRVIAHSALFSRRTPAPDGAAQSLDVPDVVHVLTELPDGTRGVYHLSGVALFGPPLQVHLYGSRGTMKIEFGASERVWAGQAGDEQLRELAIPVAERGGWRVEAEFIGAIRGEEPLRFTDFATGLRYMQFTEAVMRSAEVGAMVSLDAF
jgi:predicted dehydrogenase